MAEDPGLLLFQYGMDFLQRTKYADDTLAAETATASSTTLQKNRITLDQLLTEQPLGDEDTDDEDGDGVQFAATDHYLPTPFNLGETVRGLATLVARGPGALNPEAVANSNLFNTKKRKQSHPERRTEEVAAEVLQTIEDLHKLPTFAETGAFGVQCSWCEKWRFVSPAYHEVLGPEIDSATFECPQLRWANGDLVGISCETEEQDWRPPNPKDQHAKDPTKARIELRAFEDWWTEKQSAGEDGEDEEDLNTLFKTHYWEFLCHRGTIVPEGYADHPTHTLRLAEM